MTTERRFLIHFAVLFGFCIPVGSSARATELKWTFKAGESHRYRMETKTVSEVTLPGQTVKTTMLQTTETTWRVHSVDAKGNAEIALRFDRFLFRADTPQGRVDFDTNSSNEPSGLVGATLVPSYRALAGSTFHYTMTPTGNVDSILIPADVLKKLREAVETTADSPKFSEDSYKDLVRDQVLSFPGKELKRGDSWTRQTRAFAPTGVHIHDKTYTYEGPDTASNAEMIRLGVKVEVRSNPGADPILGVHIDEQEDKALYTFDNKNGHLIKSSRDQVSQVTYTLKAGRNQGKTYRERKTVNSSLKLIESKSGTVAAK